MKSISQRLAALERRPQSMIPRFTIEYADGHRENFIGTDIISHHDGIRRITFDGQHQPSVDAAALYRMLHDDVEVVEQ